MKTRGDKLLLAALAFGIVFYLLSMRYAPSITSLGDVSAAVGDASSTLEHYSLKTDIATRWKLPKRLEEISGLAFTPDGRLLAHNDEKGVVFEIDPQDGSVVKAFKLTDLDKAIADDFEGIAVVDETVYLVTSIGRIYAFPEGADGQAVLFTMYTTGIGRDCEIEGLAYEPNQRALLLMCKNPLSPEQAGKLTLYRWSIDTKRLIDDAHTSTPIADFAQHLKGKKFQPSGIERHPGLGYYFLVAARQAAIAEITPEGKVIAVEKLPADWHRQAEGITFAPDHTLIVADEGAGKRARLTLYPVSRNR